MSLTVTLALLVAALIQTTPAPIDCNDADHQAFAFWVGDWDVSPTGTETVVAHSVISTAAGGSMSAPGVTQRFETSSLGVVDTVSMAQDRVRVTLGLRHQQLHHRSFRTRAPVSVDVGDVHHRHRAQTQRIERSVAAMPLPTVKRNEGQRDVPVQVQGVWVRPGDWLYADEDGIVVSATALHG